MAITHSGTKIFIATGATANSSPTTQAAYEALTWTEIEDVTEVGDRGDEANIISYKTLSNGRVQKAVGTSDGGTIAVTVVSDLLAAGQTALKMAAANKKLRHNFKIIEPDRADANDTDTVEYFGAYVAAGRKNATSEGGDAMRMRTYNLAVTTAYIEVPTTVVP